MVTPITEDLVISDIVKFETDQRFSREIMSLDATNIVATTALAAGDILEPGSDTAMKKILASAANADAILLGVFGPATAPGSVLHTSYTMPTPAVDLQALVLVRGPAIVDHTYLDYQSQTEATVNAALLDEGVLVRTGPTYTKLSDQQ